MIPSIRLRNCFSIRAGCFGLVFKPMLVMGYWISPFVFMLFVKLVLSSIYPEGTDVILFSRREPWVYVGTTSECLWYDLREVLLGSIVECLLWILLDLWLWGCDEGAWLYSPFTSTPLRVSNVFLFNRLLVVTLPPLDRLLDYLYFTPSTSSAAVLTTEGFSESNLIYLDLLLFHV
jgi:hypothetical protein